MKYLYTAAVLLLYMYSSTININSAVDVYSYTEDSFRRQLAKIGYTR